MNDLFNVFIYSGGKCGSSTLALTLNKSSYHTIHIHGCCYYEKITNGKNIFNTINNSSKHYEKIYIIDSYRTPIERKISSFFQNIKSHLPSYETLNINQLIEYFNSNLLYNLEDYHPIDEVMDYYNIPKFETFDFEKGYNIAYKDNLVIVKLLFNDIDKWDKILTQIFKKKITMYNRNLTKDKPIYNLYNNFKINYKVPKEYLLNNIKNDKYFKIYNTINEQEQYIKKHLEKSY